MIPHLNLMLSRIWVDIGVSLENAIFANNERARLDMKKQEEETSKKCNFFDDDDDDDDDDNDKKDFPVDIPFKMEDDFPSGYNDDGDVLVKKESGNEMDDRETPFEYPKRENDIDDRETILYASTRRKSEDEIDEKTYNKPNLETPEEIEQQAKINDRNFIKNKLEQNNNDLTLSEKAELKKLQDVFDEVKKGEPL